MGYIIKSAKPSQAIPTNTMKYEKICDYANLPRKQKKKAKKIIASSRWQMIQWAYLVKKEYGKFELDFKTVNIQD